MFAALAQEPAPVADSTAAPARRARGFVKDFIRPEKPTHRAHGREQHTGGRSPRRDVGATTTETGGGATGREQREQAAEAQPAARPQEGAGRRRQGERRRRHACPHGTD